jgi:hypothetical protein
MRTFTSLALVTALGLGAVALSRPADAGVVVGVGAVPVATYYRYPHAYPGWRYGYGWHRGWYHGRYWRR